MNSVCANSPLRCEFTALTAPPRLWRGPKGHSSALELFALHHRQLIAAVIVFILRVAPHPAFAVQGPQLLEMLGGNEFRLRKSFAPLRIYGAYRAAPPAAGPQGPRISS